VKNNQDLLTKAYTYLEKLSKNNREQENEILRQFAEFPKFQKDLVLSHVTHNLNDLNTASIRISKLSDLMKEYEPSKFDVSQNHYHFAGMWTVIIIILCLYICSKCGLFKVIKNSLKPKKDNVIYALEDVSSPDQNNTNDQGRSLMEEVTTEDSRQPRRSSRLMRLRN